MTNECPTDATDGDRLVRRAKLDRDAFGQLFDRYYPRVLRFATRRLCDRGAAEEVTSEVFLQVAAHLRQFAGDTESEFRRWLFRIAANAANAQARQTHRRTRLLRTAIESGRLPTGNTQTDERADARLDWPVVQQALSELDEREQTIVALRFFGGLTAEEIGAAVDTSSGAVRTALYRALARLKERFAPSAAQTGEKPGRGSVADDAKEHRTGFSHD